MRHLDALVSAAVPFEETLPEGMLEQLGLAAPTGAGKVIDLAAVRAQRAAAVAPSTVRRSPVWLGRAAAGLALAVTIGAGLNATLAPSLGIHSSSQPSAETMAAEYTALGDAARSAPSGMQANAVAIFAASVPAQQVQAMIGQAGARVVSGPSSTGAWQLAIAPGRRDAALAALRSHRDVTLAEPLDGDTP
jgi:hypothetical protein